MAARVCRDAQLMDAGGRAMIPKVRVDWKMCTLFHLVSTLDFGNSLKFAR